jgi:ADP-heptose:LPS heptosyltransferase
MLGRLERVVRGRRVPAAEAREILILQYVLPLGCCVHLTPVYEAIKRKRPDVRVSVATRGLGADLLRHHQFVDRVLITPDPLTDLAAAVRSLRTQLGAASMEPEWVLTGATDLRYRIALMALASGGVRAGFTMASELYAQTLTYDAQRSLIDNNLRLAEMLGAGVGHLEPRIFYSSEEAERARKLLRDANPEDRSVLVLVTQTSGGQKTGWHRDRFVQVIRFASETLQMQVVYVGTGPELAAIEEIRNAAGGIGTVVAGKTSVTELAALVAGSDAMLSLDTGTMHVGRAAGTPMVVIGPSWQKPTEWMPLGAPQATILRGPDRETVPEGYRLDEVEAADVTRALADLVARFPPSAEEREARVRRSICDLDRVVS